MSRLIYGARLSLRVGLAATTLNLVVAVLIGGISGFLGGGKVDLAMQRFVDAWPGPLSSHHLTKHAATSLSSLKHSHEQFSIGGPYFPLRNASTSSLACSSVSL
ncbi:hypothetical protein KFU94_57600 [Chloroflexi bacterium TSY]|nr:hypothetical protein [Chloroflexi bacterium TSY]